MGPSVSFPLLPRIAKKLPIRNSWELLIGKLPIPLPMFYFYYFELIREALANTLYKNNARSSEIRVKNTNELQHELREISSL